MISKGRDVRTLFPNVVKNVICDNLQVKRLVYMFLIHYAEFEQDLALLSINTFQKDLDNPSPLIRSQALRVLSSIRLKVITHILIISVKRCVGDNSPYVRKTAAHAIPKIYSLDHEKKEELVDCIETLIGDNTTLVLGSALTAFSEVCPERIDLLHPHFRKLCNMVADTDEWGQITMVNILTRYARCQFANPNPNERTKTVTRAKKKTSFYSDDDSDDSGDYDAEYDDGFEMDPDHRLLLRSVSPLLQSRNNGVVVAVAMMLYYCAPAAEALKIGKPMVRLVRNPPQIAYLVLCNIATISRSRPEMFSAYLTEFFVYDNDPEYIRELKLEILINVATESNINRILKEFTHYVKLENKKFVSATIQAIGTSAARLPEVQETCMQRLISLLSNRSEVVVAESVVVIKKLLQLGQESLEGEENTDQTRIVTHLAKLLDSIQVPNARASIIWIVGEYCTKIPLYAPDILRKLAQSFKNEAKITKLQILTLASKLVLANPNDATVSLIFQYVCNMAKFDMNYDLRDRARVLRVILIGNNAPTLKQKSLELLCSTKPAPEIVQVRDAGNFALNSLSHIVNHTAFGYQPLPEWPEEIPDPSVRNQVARKQRNAYGMPSAAAATTSTGGTSGFYSDEESSEYSDFDESYEDSYEDEDDFYGSSKPKAKSKASNDSAASFFGTPEVKKEKKVDSFFDDDDDFSDDDFSEESPAMASGASAFFDVSNSSPLTPTAKPSTGDLLNTDLLGLSLDEPSTTPTASPLRISSDVERSRLVLLKQVMSQGLQVEYLFLRRSSIQGPSFNPIQLYFINNSDNTFRDVVVKGSNDSVVPNDIINVIPPHSTAEALLNVKFSSPTMPVKMTVAHQENTYPVSLQPPPGELISQSGSILGSEFAAMQKKLGGMQEVSGKFPICDLNMITSKVLEKASVNVLKSDVGAGIFQFAGKCILDGNDILISVEVREGIARLKVNCNNAIFATTLHRELKKTLEKK